jgi:hypothetical protein
MMARIELWLNDINRGKTKVLGEKYFPAPLHPPQISHGQIWDRIWASAV